MNSAITEAELKVMKVLWKASPRSSCQIWKELETTEQWQRTTVNTLLKRLEAKDAIYSKKHKNYYKYYPNITQKCYITKESKNFLERVFDGAAKSLFIHFCESQELNKHEIEELKKILENMPD